jgi:uracil-DNA glycosylase
MLVGEQPGDREDTEGRPFVGPAGRLLDRALDDAGIDRADVYVTNAVKHFTVEAARQAAHPPETQRRGDRRLPPLARRAAFAAFADDLRAAAALLV